MAALELRMLKSSCYDKAETDGDAREQGDEARARKRGRCRLGPTGHGHKKRHADENSEHAPGDFPREDAHVLVVAAHILGWPTGGLAKHSGARLHSGRGRAGRQVALHEVV